MKTNITKWDLEKARQDMNDLYRQYRTCVIHFNYDEQTARMSSDGKDQGVIIFGTTFKMLEKLARGAKTCTVEKAYERMKEIHPAK